MRSPWLELSDVCLIILIRQLQTKQPKRTLDVDILIWLPTYQKETDIKFCERTRSMTFWIVQDRKDHRSKRSVAGKGFVLNLRDVVTCLFGAYGEPRASVR